MKLFKVFLLFAVVLAIVYAQDEAAGAVPSESSSDAPESSSEVSAEEDSSSPSSDFPTVSPQCTCAPDFKGHCLFTCATDASTDGSSSDETTAPSV